MWPGSTPSDPGFLASGSLDFGGGGGSFQIGTGAAAVATAQAPAQMGLTLSNPVVLITLAALVIVLFRNQL